MTPRRFHVQSIARAVLGRNRSRRPVFMAILSAYLDASGSVIDPKCCVFTVAGYVGTDEQWEAFEDEWQHALDDVGVTHLHMKHFAHSRGEFLDWKGDEPRRARFLERLTGIIRSLELEDFSVALNMEHYRKVDKHFKMTESLGAYAMIAAAAIGKIEAWHGRYRRSDSTALPIGERRRSTRFPPQVGRANRSSCWPGANLYQQTVEGERLR